MPHELAARIALEKHGFHFSRSLGQNFLLDDNYIARIADAANVQKGENILEIGAGAGVLTAEMADRGANVVALEVDRALENVLRDVLGERENVSVRFEDALKCDLANVFGGGPYRVIANLPYYITADALEKLTAPGLPVTSVTLMVQREACERIMAAPGQKRYCALAATVQYYGRVAILFDVPPAAFTPPPHVDSVLMRVDLYGDEKPVRARDDAAMRALIQTAFAMRRKTLANNIAARFAVNKEEAASLLRACGLPEQVRGEALTLAQMAALADEIAARHYRTDRATEQP